MKAIIATAVGALTLGGLVTAQALKSPSSEAQPAKTVYAAGLNSPATGPVLVNCGEGRRALVRPVSLEGQQVSQVDCVDNFALPMTVDAYGQPVASPYLASYTTAAAARPAVQYRSAPTTYRTSSSTSSRPATRVRDWKKSALIIGGSAAGGAGLGAILGGKDGAKKGAIVGGIAGTVYDIATRSKTN